MKIVLFCHSLLSDWNHGNAHFLRGLVCELVSRGHHVTCYEERDAWSVRHLTAEQGELRLAEVRRHYPELEVVRYVPEELELERCTDGAELVLVHEWTERSLVEALGELRARSRARFRLLFHDTHHRPISAPHTLPNLAHYDGVLAFGEALRELYLRAGWARRVWTFQEAADTRRFGPRPATPPHADLVWIGNYGDGERSAELDHFLFEPARALGLSGNVYGVRYEPHALRAVRAAGLRYRGWLPNYRVPEIFARHRVTVHVPRRPYTEALPGIPTIRVFEALACGIPLICSPWDDSEGLFRPDEYFSVENGEQMRRTLELVLNDRAAALARAERGRETVLARHTCAVRAEQLLSIAHSLGAGLKPRALSFHDQEEQPR